MNGMLWHVVLLSLTLVSMSSFAGIVVNSTRVIYPADKKEVTIGLKNTSSHPALLQSWIDTGDPLAMPEKHNVPFVIMPPIIRIDGGKGQTLRMIYTGGTLPGDRESIFWLNILTVPPKNSATKNHLLNVAYQIRIKIFFRPSGLPGKADEAGAKMVWKKTDSGLSVTNPTPYYVSLVSIERSAGKDKYSLPGEMIAPFSTQFLKEKVPCFKCVKKISFSVINDLGALTQFDTEL